jgi:hypothetical protein
VGGDLSGKALRIHTDNTIVGYFLTGAGKQRPFRTLASGAADEIVLPSNFLTGQAQAISNGFIAGWVDADSQDQGSPCFWKRTGNGGLDGPYVIPSPRKGWVVGIDEGTAGTFIYGNFVATATEVEQPFAWKVVLGSPQNEDVVLLDNPGQMKMPFQSSQGSLVGDGPYMPYVWFGNPGNAGDDRMRRGIANDFNAIMTPRDLRRPVLGSTQLTGINGGRIGGHDFGDAKLWVTTQETGWGSFEVTSAVATIGQIVAGNATDASGPNGLALIAKQFGPIPDPFTRARVVLTGTYTGPSAPFGDFWARTTTRNAAAGYKLVVEYYNYAINDWSPPATFPLEKYMQTRDYYVGFVGQGGTAPFFAQVGTDWQCKIRLTIKQVGPVLDQTNPQIEIESGAMIFDTDGA